MMKVASERSHFSFKLFVLYESSYSYVLNICVYTGRGNHFGSNYPNLITSRVDPELLNKVIICS